MQDIRSDLSEILNDLLKDLKTTNSLDKSMQIKNKYLGKQSKISQLLTAIPTLQKDQKRDAGIFINSEKQKINELINKKIQDLKKEVQNIEEKSVIDKTLYINDKTLGSTHPVSEMLEKLEAAFRYYGFSIVAGPEIETDWFCFEALNLPKDHPSRDLQDTFYIKEDHILPRTHTSSVQIRTMLNHKPPIRILAPGRVYRNENSDLRHTFMFYQFEGLVIDEKSSIVDLKSILTGVLRQVFENNKIELRLRHSYFPYTEPSFEIDATCMNCLSKGCRVCSNKGWIELLGAGMVHPQVLRNVNIDPEKFQGFAFGGGPERLIMVKNNINDSRILYENDLRILEQFSNI